MNKYTFIKIALIAITLGCLAMFTMSSCRAGYGCKGRESWNHMTRRINSPY